MDRGRLRGLVAMWRPRFSRRVVLEGAAAAVLLIVAFSATRRPGSVGPSKHRSGGRCDFPAIFNFGDSNSDTGGLSAAFHRLHLPNGVTFFGRPSGRYCDGKLIIDFIADKLGLPYLHPYLDSIGADFQHGANFATSASTIEPLDARMFQEGFSPISLGIQLEQFEQFKARTLELHSRGSSYAKSSLPRPEDFAKALYAMDIGQNDLHFSLGSMTQKQVLEFIPNITAVFARSVEVSTIFLSSRYGVYIFSNSWKFRKSGLVDEGFWRSQVNFWPPNPATDEEALWNKGKFVPCHSPCLPKKLYQHGARAFWIHNTGPIGCLPFSLVRHPPGPNSMDPHGCIASHNNISQEFNRQLKDWVSKLRLQLPDAKLNYIDIYSVKHSLISEAKKHGFVSPLTYCCGHLGVTGEECWNKGLVNGAEVLGTPCDDPLKVISWDGSHYSHAANEWVAKRILDGSLSDIHVPIIESCPELPIQ